MAGESLPSDYRDAGGQSGGRHATVERGWVNRQHRRVGHVFQGRYKAILVEKDAYLLELALYVVLNPVRAGMVAEPGDWPWSSYHAVFGDAPPPDWLHVNWLLAQFSPDRQTAIRQYIDFVRSGVGLPPIWQDLVGQVFLGSESFIAKLGMSAEQAANPEISRAQRRPLAKPLADYYSGQ